MNLSVAIVQCALLHKSLCTLVQNVHLCMIALAHDALVQQLIYDSFCSIIKLCKVGNIPQSLDIYIVNVQTMRKIAQIFVPFPEKLNFTIAPKNSSKLLNGLLGKLILPFLIFDVSSWIQGTLFGQKL